MAEILGISQYMKIEVQPDFVRRMGTRNWKLISNLGSYFLTTLGLHGLPASPYLSTSCLSLCMYVVFYHCAGLNKSSTFKFIYSHGSVILFKPLGENSVSGKCLCLVQ